MRGCGGIALTTSTTPARVTWKRERVITSTAPMLMASPAASTFRGWPTGREVPSSLFFRCSRLRRRSYSLFSAGVRIVFGTAAARGVYFRFFSPRLGPLMRNDD